MRTDRNESLEDQFVGRLIVSPYCMRPAAPITAVELIPNSVTSIALTGIGQTHARDCINQAL